MKLHRFQKREKKLLLGILLIAGFVFLDQAAKYMAVLHLKGRPSMKLITNVLEFYYVENRGAAWGMFSGFRLFLILITVAALVAILWVYLQLGEEKRYRWLNILLPVLAAGALGNCMDRVCRGYVVDFIYVSCIQFPVFNIADCYVVVSGMLGLLIYRKEVREWMKNG